jgi:hypothetical protein
VVVARLFLAAALSAACTVKQDGTGYLAGDGGDGRPPNVVRADGGDTAVRTDAAPVTPPRTDAATPPVDATVPPIDAPAEVAPPDMAPPPPVCTAGERRCNGKVPETCTAGTAWTPAAACPYLCTAGNCTGECVPGANRCADRAPQICSADGHWQTQMQCPFQCSGGACTGVCQPRSVVCMGSRRRTCRADASGYDDMDCPAPEGGTAVCRDATCGFECNNPARRFRCGNNCCQCLRHEDCPANNVCTAGACKYQAPVIHITGGFYGRNCQGMGFMASPPDARPDRTAHLAQVCEGKTSCEYDVDHTVIGDPAVFCGKIYEATWQCVSGATRTSHMATLPAEASFGPNLKIVCAP